MTVRWQDMLKHIESVGVTLPSGVGATVTLKSGPEESEAIRELLVRLEDRRALFASYNNEIKEYVIHSVDKMRETLLVAITKLPAESQAIPWLKGMGESCRTFFDAMNNTGTFPRSRGIAMSKEERQFLKALEALRKSFIDPLIWLSAAYKIDINGDLARIVQPTIFHNKNDEDAWR